VTSAWGKSAGGFKARSIHPIRDGLSADFERTAAMLPHFIAKAHKLRHLVCPRIMICMPTGNNSVVKRTVTYCVRSTGAGMLLPARTEIALRTPSDVSDDAGSR